MEVLVTHLILIPKLVEDFQAVLKILWEESVWIGHFLQLEMLRNWHPVPVFNFKAVFQVIHYFAFQVISVGLDQVVAEII